MKEYIPGIERYVLFIAFNCTIVKNKGKVKNGKKYYRGEKGVGIYSKSNALSS